MDLNLLKTCWNSDLTDELMASLSGEKSNKIISNPSQHIAIRLSIQSKLNSVSKLKLFKKLSRYCYNLYITAI